MRRRISSWGTTPSKVLALLGLAMLGLGAAALIRVRPANFPWQLVPAAFVLYAATSWRDVFSLKTVILNDAILVVSDSIRTRSLPLAEFVDVRASRTSGKVRLVLRSGERIDFIPSERPRLFRERDIVLELRRLAGIPSPSRPSSPNPPGQVSARSTFMWKFVVPIVGAVGFMAANAFAFLTRDPPGWFTWVQLLFIAFGIACLALTRLKRVTLVDNHFVISNFVRELEIGNDEIESTQFLAFGLVRMKLRHTGEFGRTILYLAKAPTLAPRT